jgi:cysteinyl-tRNA synthetase
MQQEIRIYNTLSRKKENFEPLAPPHVGMYVCGPTVYGDAHLGHARAAVTFDTVFRYLQYAGYKVRYVRNITDVGHLTDELAGEGEDKISKRAKLEQLEPMEVVEHYTQSYHADMDKLNVKRPSIEPRASGHIIEQITMIQQILDKGFAYEVNGSVYFDVQKYNQSEHYGKLSGRVIEDLLSGTRELDGQQEKRSPLDFALWKKASPEHIMRWPSPWSDGFPGWHLECSAMSSKYLGKQFDIHGGGMDLMFPHHECEIAQSQACNHTEPARFWMHNNMITINGQKMGKSLNNFITLKEFYSGSHSLLEQAYSPMAIRFFMLQAHYRSPLDFSNEALLAAQKGYKRIINGLRIAKELQYDEAQAAPIEAKEADVNKQIASCFGGLNDDFNTAVTIAGLFNLLKKINSYYTNPASVYELSKPVFDTLIATYVVLVEDVLGLLEEKPAGAEGLLEAMLEIYKEAKAEKAYDKVDKIRSYFKAQGLLVKDMKSGVAWAYEE